MDPIIRELISTLRPTPADPIRDAIPIILPEEALHLE